MNGAVRRQRRVSPRMLGAAAVLLGLGGWWLAGTRSSDPGRPDVAVFADGAGWQARDDIARRVRQAGFSVEIVGLPGCDEWSSMSISLADHVVLACAFEDGVSRPSQAFGRRPFPLVGTPASPSKPCEWWDTGGPGGEARPGLGQCRTNGTVVVWEGDRLTPAGMERMARSIVATLA